MKEELNFLEYLGIEEQNLLTGLINLKEEFDLLFETLNEKWYLVINKIEGSGEKTDYINIKINYKNNPKISCVSLMCYILPYVMIAIIMLLPLPFLLKRYKKWKSY